jgi:hypothetical protein
MAWKLDNPLYCLSDEEETKKILRLWEEEKHGGVWEGNNRLPYPFTFLIALIVLTAFLLTMPLWGQRPTAAIYSEFVKMMDNPEVQKIADPQKRIQYIYQQVYPTVDKRTQGLLERHPLSWYDLENLAPQIRELEQGGTGYPLDNYNVVGDKVVLANFEGNYRPDGRRSRIQPWWDKGYTIDVFYVSYFVITMVLVIKRLPHFTRKPNMTGGGAK